MSALASLKLQSDAKSMHHTWSKGLDLHNITSVCSPSVGIQHLLTEAGERTKEIACQKHPIQAWPMVDTQHILVTHPPLRHT